MRTTKEEILAKTSQRAQRISLMYAELGSKAAVARKLGISPQRVCQILSKNEAAAKREARAITYAALRKALF